MNISSYWFNDNFWYFYCLRWNWYDFLLNNCCEYFHNHLKSSNDWLLIVKYELQLFFTSFQISNRLKLYRNIINYCQNRIIIQQNKNTILYTISSIDRKIWTIYFLLGRFTHENDTAEATQMANIKLSAFKLRINCIKRLYFGKQTHESYWCNMCSWPQQIHP